MQFNKPLKILAESFEIKEQLGQNSNGEEEKKVKLKGLALTLGKPTRNGVIYSLNDDSILRTMEGKPFLDTHNDDSALNSFGHVERFWKEGNNLMYEVDIDPEETKFVRKAKRGDLPGTSVQVLCNTAEEDQDGNIHANIDSFLELSAVTIPGEGDSTATLLEAFGKKDPRTIFKTGQEREEKVEKRGDEWCVVHCHGPKAGQTIACHDTKEGAEAQHRAIMAGKGQRFTGDNMDIQKEQAEGDGRPDKGWWKKCIDKASSFADDPEAFCGALYYDPERFEGGVSMKKAYGEELLNEMTEEFVRNNFAVQEDLTTADGSGGALVGETRPKRLVSNDKENKKEIGPIAAVGAGLVAKKFLDKERIYDPAKAAAKKPNYDGEEELEDSLDDIQDTGKKAKPEDKRNLIPKAKTAKAEQVSRKLTELNNRIKRIEVRQRIEKINRKLEGMKNAKVKKKGTGTV